MPKARETWHEVQEDEDLEQIASIYGFRDWKAIWEHPDNEELRKARPDPQILYEGDKVWIPEVAVKEFECETNKKHTFTIYEPRRILHLYMEDEDGIPLADKRYEIWIDGERFGEGEKRTREDGLIFEPVPVVPAIEVRLWPGKLEEEEEEAEDEDPDYDEDEEEGDEEDEYVSYWVQMGHLDPHDTVSGAQDRLRNLGYFIPDEEQGELGEATKAALEDFQEDYHLQVTGEPDEATQELLLNLQAKQVPEATAEDEPSEG